MNSSSIPPEGAYRTSNVVFYSILVPIATCGNILSTIVVSYIVRHQQARRSIPDVLLGFLALLDLFSVLGIHSITLVAMITGAGPPTGGTCYYQGFAVAVYLKLEFLLQVCISLDRYIALVRPLHYYRVSSMKVVRICAVCVVLVSLSTSAVLLGTSPSVAAPLDTWEICITVSDIHYIPHIVIIAVISLIFVAGFVVFVYCNVSLVRILWQYHAKRTNSVLREINDAVEVMDRDARHKGTKNPRPHRQVSAGSAQGRPSRSSANSPCSPVVRESPLQRKANSRQNSHSSQTFPAKVTQPTQKNVTIYEKNKNAKNKPGKGDLLICNTRDNDIVSKNDSPCSLIGIKKINNLIITIEEPSSVVLPDADIISEKASGNRLSVPCADDCEPSKYDKECETNILGNYTNDNEQTVKSSRPVPPSQLDIGMDKPKEVNAKSPTSPQSNKTSDDVTTPTVIRHEQFVQFQQHVTKLLRKVEKKAQRQRRELLLARLVILCASVFAATWIPFIVVNVLSWCQVYIHPIVTDISLKLIFANAFLNPIFYGLCRGNYRKGYLYVTQMAGCVLTCGIIIDRPGEDKVFYESRRKKQRLHQEAAEMNRRQDKLRKRRVSAQALQIIQHTLNFRRAASPQDNRKRSSFVPSNRLQELFERVNALESETTDSSSIDYDALALLDLSEGDIVQNLEKIWSMYALNLEQQEIIDEEPDIELDVDYDALVAADLDIGSDDVFIDMAGQNNFHQTFPKSAPRDRVAMSTPSGIKGSAEGTDCREYSSI